MHRRFLNVTGFVLAGGASRRMGRPKAHLVLAGETMLQRQIRLLGSITRSVAVLGPPESLTGVEVPAFPDELPGRGPLGAVYTGLLRTRTEFNLFLGCDLPFMEARFLGYLCARAVETGADTTVPETPAHGYQPLCALYRRRALPAVRAILASGENKVSRFFPRVHCRVIRWPEIARAGFSSRIFHNMNRPEEYQEAFRRLAASFGSRDQSTARPQSRTEFPSSDN